MAFFDPFGGLGSGSSSGDGAPGKDGRGISSIVFVSSTGGSIAGIAGATDTYRINYTDGTTSTYTVKNGNNGERGPKGDAGEQGPKGDTGENGRGIENIVFKNSSVGTEAGTAGAIDTYIINYTDSTSIEFQIKNGENGTPAIIDTEMSDASENAVQNKIIKKYVDDIVGDIQTILSTLTTVE